MGRKLEIVLNFVLCTIVLLICSTKAQETQVLCFPQSTSIDRCSTTEGVNMSYSSCCTQVGGRLYQLNDATCTTCGPVLNEEATVPITVGNNIIILQLQLEEGSIPADTYVIRQSTNSSLPITTVVLSTRTQFIGLDAGTQYIFRIYALSGDLLSLPVQVEWVAGVSSLPSFTNFTEDSKSTDRVSVTWDLENPGVRPVEQVIVRWMEENDRTQLPLPEDFPANNTQIFVPPIQTFSCNFTGLSPAQRYVVLIQGTNLVGMSNTYFVIETDPLPSVNTPGAVSAAPSNIPSLPLVLLCSLVVVTKCYI